MQTDPPQTLSADCIIEEIERIRAAIRYHRDQVSDYRCWVDDLRIYASAGLDPFAAALLAGQVPEKNPVPIPTEFLDRCALFWDKRQFEHEKGKGDVTVNSSGIPLKLPLYSDDDLRAMDLPCLSDELTRLRLAVLKHRDLGFGGRSIDSDVALYDLMPECVVCNSALPPRQTFLANCANFCDHCQRQPEDLLEWANRL